MTAILGIFASDGCPADEGLVTRMLGRMSSRGSQRASVWREGGVVIAVSRHEWEFGPDFSGPVMIVQDGDHVIAADASLYYRDDLRRKLAAKGVRPKGQTPSHLILAAYQAFGEKCPEILEGDFSFVIWDRKTRRVVAARDSSATRPLFFAELGSSLIFASEIPAILEYPACTGELDLAALAVDAAAVIFATTDQTAYRDIRRLNGAMTLVASWGARVRVYRHWTPAVTSPQATSSLDEGADQLLWLLRDAVTERLDSNGRTSLWLSGGWDSTAVLAVAQSELRKINRPNDLAPVSMSLPADDPWCETHRTTAVGVHWDVPIRWLKSEDIPLLVDPHSSARERPEPWSHEYEQMMRALVGATRADDSRIALNGHGGDFLFYCSPIFMADLVAGGHILRLWKEWRAMPRRTPRAFFEYAIQPALPDSALRVAAWLRHGRRLPGYVERPIPHWFDEKFVSDSGITSRAIAASPRIQKGVSRARSEIQWILMQPHFDRVVSTTARFALEDGVETRMPLMDRRLVDFAMARPWWERRSAGEDKHLVRHAMRTMLPPEVLAPRPFKTGSLGGYFTRALQRVLPELLHLAQAPVLAELGIIDGTRLRNAVNTYNRSMRQDNQLGVQLLSTLQAELWLRSRGGKPSSTLPDSVETPAIALSDMFRQQGVTAH